MRLPGDDALGSANARLGTRFWIYPQPPFIPGYEQPDRVWLSIPRDEIGEGPSDLTVYVVDPLVDKQPYGFNQFPPFDGAKRLPAMPGPDRHFDNLSPNSRAFLSVHAYACVRFVLDIWQSYLGHPIRWFFAQTFPRLEIIAFVNWDNAHAGYGFLELGCSDVEGIRRPYALNFDTIAHEIGHIILLSETGIPTAPLRDSDFFAFSEAFSDVVSLISFLQFDSAIDRLLRRTRGNLLLYNELNRFAETSPETQIRLATNFRRMSETTREVHDRALPFIGAIFDTIVELYHRELVERDCADTRLLDFDIRDLEQDEFDRFRQMTAAAFQVKPMFFRLALTAARDAVGQALAGALPTLDPDTLRLDQAANAVISAASGATAELLEANFAWREIISQR
ncbi:hypothetical protein [Sinorhizobium terangae]|uniref:Peptidase M4 C-terminal domain-containing protein n=1 Tax=Sinorhizobium terangae TaxID=110322 RepID=A0A6N7L9D7_SINTE|nr:hypothetical protein [Sinorhizobium terangae]MBB4185599.1 hypothetical protein [Sinorhizobium terangae]MQX13354.1 hypothetical protein [Sinorhizobium terangae]WFU46337.1 hypothetical protein QA637_10490 [Sinorhizobium terangae]